MEDFRIYLDETNPDGTRTRYTRQLSSLSLKDCVSNENLQHAESSASVTIPYDAELFSLLARSKELDAQIINGNDEALFTGTVTVDISWTDNGKNDEIDKFSLTVKDYSSKFSRKTESEILLENTNLAAVAAHFAQMCGVTIAQTLPETPIQVICIEKGKQILASLEAILYQYGFSFYFSPEGIMKFFDWRDVPENPPELPPDKIRTGFSGSKTTKNYTGVSVSFNTLTTKRNELVYFQGNGYDSNDDPAPFYVQPGVYFPYESSPVLEETDGIVHQSFAQSYAEAKKKYNGEYDYQRNKTATLLYSKNHYVEREWDGTITIDRTNFESKQAAVRLRNTGSADAKVYKLGIRADAVYRDAASTVTAGDQSGNVFTTDFEFVYEMTTAESIAKALLAYFAKGNLSFRFMSEEKIEPGSFRRIDTGATGLSCTVFIRSRTLEGKDEQYLYEAQSVSDFVIQTEKSSVSYSQEGAAALAAVSNLKQALNEGRGNYVPDKITGVKAIAGHDGITITCSQPPKGLKNTISKYIVEISRDEGASYSSFTALAIPFEYSFIRVQTAANAPFDGYPEASDLQKYRIRIKAENVYGNQSEDWSEPLIPDTAEYGTWLLSAPVISPSVSHRSVLLRFSQPTLSSGRERYGTIRHRVEIRQIDLDAAGDFFKPNETDDPNEAETNYKAKAAEGQNDFVRGYIEVAGDYSQTLPLKGQNEATPAPTFTTYQYRITAVNEKGISESATVNVVARPTSVVDVVRGWEINEQGEKVKVPGALGAENIYAEELSAISVNLGRIKAGILQSDIEAGETKPNVMLDLDGQEFRVGNSPHLEEAGSEDAEYLHWIKSKGLFMKMKNFILDSIGSLVKGVMTVISTIDNLRRTVISNIGMQIQFLTNNLWKTVAEVIVDNAGNMIITNDPDNQKPIIIPYEESNDIDKPNGVYHLNGSITDDKGRNFAELDITGIFDNVNPAIDNTQYLVGTVEKEIAEEIVTSYRYEQKILPISIINPRNEITFICEFMDCSNIYNLLVLKASNGIKWLCIYYKSDPSEIKESFVLYQDFAVQYILGSSQLKQAMWYEMADIRTQSNIVEYDLNFFYTNSRGVYKEMLRITFNISTNKITNVTRNPVPYELFLFPDELSSTERNYYQFESDTEPKYFSDVMNAVPDETEKRLLNSIHSRYLCWLKGSCSVLGIPIFATPKKQNGDDLFHFAVLVFRAEQNTVDYVIYNMQGNLIAQDSILLNLATATDIKLIFEGSMQEIYIDYGDQIDDAFIRRLYTEKHQTGCAADGYDAAKQWYIFNAKDPSAVSSNAFYCKNEPSVPIGFTYIQFPGEMSPDVLFGGGTWQNIASQYPGAFFRAEGGNASAFGAGLQGMMIQSHDHSSFWRYVGGGSTGPWGSGWAVTNGGSPTGGVETRPINYTIRIWKRTA